MTMAAVISFPKTRWIRATWALILFTLLPSIDAGAQNLLRWPESIVYDARNDRYIVSNYLTETLVEIDSVGNQSYFVTGESTIQGLEIVGNTVYVGCGSSVRGFDLTTAERVLYVEIPEAVNLNDVTADTSGNLYVSDVYGHAIYRIRIDDQSYSTFATDGILYPNGILYDRLNHRLLLCSFRNHSPIQSISLEDSTVITLTETTITDCDGLTMDDFGFYYVTSWETYAIYRFDATFQNPPEFFYQSGGGPADISYNREDDILAIPLMSSNDYDLVPIYPTSIGDVSEPSPPRAFRLGQNHPNPFNPSTTIEYTVPGGHGTVPVEISIYDLRGRHIRSLIDETMEAGTYRVHWDGTTIEGVSASSGIYLYRLTIEGVTQTRKMTLVR
jgi:hypothetical protein